MARLLLVPPLHPLADHPGNNQAGMCLDPASLQRISSLHALVHVFCERRRFHVTIHKRKRTARLHVEQGRVLATEPMSTRTSEKRGEREGERVRERERESVREREMEHDVKRPN